MSLDSSAIFSGDFSASSFSSSKKGQLRSLPCLAVHHHVWHTNHPAHYPELAQSARRLLYQSLMVIYWLIFVLALVLWIFLMLKAYMGQAYKLPVAGDITQGLLARG
jgi:hypothetical protein